MPTKESKNGPHLPEFVDELVFVKVEDTVHCITKSDLTKWGGVFKDMFELPEGPDCEGKSEESPIALPDCTNLQFEALMDVIAEDGLLSERSMTKDQWIAVLQLSTKWDMAKGKVRLLAITELRKQTLTTTEKVRLGSENNVTSLFVEGCANLARCRYEPEELEILAAAFGWDFAARIMWVVSSSITKIHRKVGIPRGDLKCHRCSAILVVAEVSEPSQGTGSSGPPLGMMQPPPHPSARQLVQPANGPPNNTTSAWIHQASAHYPSVQLLGRPPAQQTKRSLSLKFSCPTPRCAGLINAKDIRLSGTGIAVGGIEGLIEKSFSEKMKEMY